LLCSDTFQQIDDDIDREALELVADEYLTEIPLSRCMGVTINDGWAMGNRLLRWTGRMVVGRLFGVCRSVENG